MPKASLVRPKEDRFVKMLAKRDGKCFECEEPIETGDLIVWDVRDGKAYCNECGAEFL